MDEFDINFIDLRDSGIWVDNNREPTTLNCINDLRHLCMMMKNCKRARCIVMFPQNCFYDYFYINGHYNKHHELKNLRTFVNEIIFEDLLGIEQYCDFFYENTHTKIFNQEMSASFYFDEKNALTKSNKSEKATTIEVGNIFLTTLDLPCNSEAIFDFVKYIGLMESDQTAPEWFEEIEMFDDQELKEKISDIKAQIDLLKTEEQIAQEQLKDNNKLKSILFTNGDELVVEVYRILEKILECDLSEFVDKKKEDFQIVKEDISFIGEIKGVNSNVKNANVSQLDVHVQNYLDTCNEKGLEVTAKGLFIINPQRKRTLNERDKVGEDQIACSLIILTENLLSIYEKYMDENITTAEIKEVFSTKDGILSNA